MSSSATEFIKLIDRQSTIDCGNWSLWVVAALHDLDPDFRSFSRSDKVVAVVSSLNYKRPAPIQSMYIFKVGQSQCPSFLSHICISSCTDEGRIFSESHNSLPTVVVDNVKSLAV